MNDDRLEPGERCASTSNRNFEGRQGAGGRTHLVSPAMAAAAGIAGHLLTFAASAAPETLFPTFPSPSGNKESIMKRILGVVALVLSPYRSLPATRFRASTRIAEGGRKARRRGQEEIVTQALRGRMSAACSVIGARDSTPPEHVMDKFTVHTGLVGADGSRQCRHRCDHPEAVPEVDQNAPATGRTALTDGAILMLASRAWTTASARSTRNSCSMSSVFRAPRSCWRGKLRLRLVARTCAVGVAAERLSRGDRTVVRRHLLQQLAQQRPAGDPLARRAG